MATEADMERLTGTDEAEVAAPALYVMSLFAQTPPGSWIAASGDGKHVLAYAGDLATALQEARKKGESMPLVLRHPEAITFIY